MKIQKAGLVYHSHQPDIAWSFDTLGLESTAIIGNIDHKGSERGVSIIHTNPTFHDHLIPGSLGSESICNNCKYRSRKFRIWG
jgi:hypothetical protein